MAQALAAGHDVTELVRDPAAPIGLDKVTGMKIAREDVARWMLGELAAAAHVGKAPLLHA